MMGAAGSLLDGNIHIVSTSRMPKVDDPVNGTANYTYMLGMRRGAVCVGNGIYNFKVAESTDAFAANIMYEAIFGVDVLGTPNTSKIAKKFITNMTNTTPFAPTL